MYNELQLIHFKAFRHLDIELRPLTLLSGLNGMGKSSTLQALLLLRQSYLGRDANVESDNRLQLILNGDLINLGTGRDVFIDRNDYLPSQSELTILLNHATQGQGAWRYEYDLGTADVLTPLSVPSSEANPHIYHTALFGDKQFHYLKAERIGPRTTMPMSDYMVSQRNQIGAGGEYAPHFLSAWESKPVHPALHHPNENAHSLRAQVTAWMGEISPGTQIDLRPHADMDLMNIRYGFAGTPTFRATNVGFGISYTLPVLIALLASEPGALVLLENPEAHLHPRGQSQMGQLMARAAQAGVQVILETHSDHIMNGIRVATKNKLIQPDEVAFHFFQKAENGLDVVVDTPELDEEGRLDYWPKQFFDEWKNSLDELLYGGS
jgi:predicted ATPase